MNTKDLASVGAKRVAPPPLPLTKKDEELLTESKVRELINNQDFVEIVRQVANAEWDGKPLVEDMVYHLKKLARLKLAIIKENRRTFRRAMKMFRACMPNGMTTPAIVVKARIVYEWGLTLIDPTSGRELTEDELDEYYCIMEGHARLDAFVLSILYSATNGSEPFDFHFVYKEYASPEEFGQAYISTNTDMTRTTNKDRLAIAGARCKHPIVISYLSKINNDHVIAKASYFWTTGRELKADEITQLTYDLESAPTFNKETIDALALCYESFKAQFSSEGSERIYRGVPAAQWCADQINNAEDKAAMAMMISENVQNMSKPIYTAILTAKTCKKEHITRDQKIKTSLDMMMNI